MSSSTLTATRPGGDPEPRPERAKAGTTTSTPAKSTRNAPTPASRGEYRPDIDGIRGAAAIMVMGFHAKVPGFEGAYIGLDLFFVVSGYVITGLLMYEFTKTGAIKWGAFYARRARRLIPAKATMIIGVLVLSYFILTPTGAGGEGPQQQTARSAAAAAGFVSNFFFLHASNAGDVDYFSHQAGTGVLLHTWSLSVEEQFYLGLPIAILLAWLLSKLLRMPVVRTLLLTTVALGVASAWLAISLADTDPDAAYYLPVTRAFEFLIGVALALVVRKVRAAEDLREVMGLAGVAIIAFVIWKPMPVEGYPSYWALLPCAAAALLVWAGVGGPTVVTRLLSIPFLVGLGLVSYGWYLWHWPFLVLGESLNLAPPPLHVRVALVLAALFVAWLSYRYIEGLFYKRSGTVSKSRTWGSRRVMISGVLAMSCVAGLSGGALALAEEAETSPHWQEVNAQLADAPELPASCLEGQTLIPSKPGQCDLVPFEFGRPTLMLWGDSHAWMYIPAIEAAARKKDVNVVAFVMGACPVFIPTETATGACARSNALALRFAERHVDDRAPLKIIISQSYETYRGTPKIGGAADASVDYVKKMATYSQLGTPALFERLAEIDADVDVVGPTPIIPRNAPLCEAISRPYSCDVPRVDAIKDEADNRDWLLGLMSGLPGAVDPETGKTRVIVTTGSEIGRAAGVTDAAATDGRSSNRNGGLTPPRLIDPVGALCNTTMCFAESGGVTYYFDDNHLSAKMSRMLKKYFVPSLRDIVGDTETSDAAAG
ncbi:acyltransferase family protein [Nocardioides rubriscoriae]|uniref:acyltransferase family protein n=1 Tax=Nocardioides rubriscoriae TaxID=642762 RepID=UPI0011E02D96|nr:acyltransferase family protein [Nocardioides rubriscoriae]